MGRRAETGSPRTLAASNPILVAFDIALSFSFSRTVFSSKRFYLNGRVVYRIVIWAAATLRFLTSRPFFGNSCIAPTSVKVSGLHAG
jgi:hypothetical protein